jgi:hypothetical protein
VIGAEGGEPVFVETSPNGGVKLREASILELGKAYAHARAQAAEIEATRGWIVSEIERRAKVEGGPSNGT